MWSASLSQSATRMFLRASTSARAVPQLPAPIMATLSIFILLLPCSGVVIHPFFTGQHGQIDAISSSSRLIRRTPWVFRPISRTDIHGHADHLAGVGHQHHLVSSTTGSTPTT